MQYEVDVDGRLRHVTVHRTNGRFAVTVDGRDSTVDAVRIGEHTWSLLIGTSSIEVTIAPGHVSGQASVSVDGVPMTVAVNGRRRYGRKDDGASRGSGSTDRLASLMPGKIARILVKIGDPVRARQPLVVIEAMKMENELRAPREGIVKELLVREGQSVDAGTLLIVVAPA